MTIFFVNSLMAQTKMIAFKSHSGNMAYFNDALEDNMFDMENSNFGNPPMRDIFTTNLDSVIYVSDSVAIMVTSEYSTSVHPFDGAPKSKPELVRTKRKIILNDPLLSRKHALDSIRKSLAESYQFFNPIDQVIFVGYDNKKPKKKKRSEFIVPVLNNDTPNNTPQQSPNTLLLSLFGLVLVVALASGMVATHKFQLKLS
ncbi:MAG: hypothetical protein ACOYKE_03035 [Ferruginibacter sp.]